MGVSEPGWAADYRSVVQPSVFWVVLDSEENTRGSMFKSLVLPHRGDIIQLADGISCVVDRFDAAPTGSHVIKGTIHAVRS